jgi:hydroxymethylpyrimidine pyrophosphatase-like HAD family hydrolase
VGALGPWARGICLSGVFTLERGQRVAGQFIDPEVAREAVTLSLDHGYVPLVYGEDHISRYLPREPGGASHGGGMVKVRDLIIERPYQPYASVGSFEALFAVRPAQVAICETPERAAVLYPMLERALGDRAYVVLQPGEPTWVEVAHPEARKDSALLAMARSLGLSAEQVLYFGDSLNDLPVFEAFPYTVAVGNARPEIKQLAWKTTASNVDDGVARFVAAWWFRC